MVRSSELQLNKLTIYVPQGVDSRHRFLAEVATLGETDRLVVSPNFLRQVAIGDVCPKLRVLRLDSSQLNDVLRNLLGMSCQRLDDCCCRVRTNYHQIARRSSKRNPHDRQFLIRNCSALIREHVGGDIAVEFCEHVRGIRAGQPQCGKISTAVAQLNVFANQVLVQVRQDRFAKSG